MPIISISRDSYSRGREIADKVAARLGCDSVGREVVLEAADAFKVDESVVEHALHDAPSFLEQLFGSKDKHRAEFKSAFYKHMAQGNVVYHGLAGHIFLADVPGALKIRIIADFEERVTEEMHRTGMSEAKARAALKRDDRERAQWTRLLYGADNHDPAMYDLCFNLSALSVTEIVDAICAAAMLPAYATGPKTSRMLEEMAVAAEAEAHLLRKFDHVQTRTMGGEIIAVIGAPLMHEQPVCERARRLLSKVPGMGRIHVAVNPAPHCDV